MEHPLLGKKAPEFSLVDQNEKTHTLADYAGQYVLLYFYPKDMTPGCTTQACTFRDSMNDFEGSGVQVLGISADSVEKHKKFAEKYSLNFPLLSDEEKTMLQDYEVWKEKSMFGKKYMGIQRDSFLVGPDGTVVKYYKKVKPADHPAEVLADVAKIA